MKIYVKLVCSSQAESKQFFDLLIRGVSWTATIYLK